MAAPTFDFRRFTSPANKWYGIATNVRPQTSVVKKLLGHGMGKENSIISYQILPDKSVQYTNSVYINGKLNPSMSKMGLIQEDDAEVPSRLRLVDSKTGKQSKFYVIDTDYDNYALIFNGTKEKADSFWILSRTPQIHVDTLLKIKEKLKGIGRFNLQDVTVDFMAIVDTPSEGEKSPNEGDKKEEKSPNKKESDKKEEKK